ncbi:unnamed protein product [Ophioblennius macclurei]
MASTSVTTVGGVVIVTQVIPKDEYSFQLNAPPSDDTPRVAVSPPSSAVAPPPETPVKVDEMTATFLRGQPLALGVVQIFLGVMIVLFSLSAFFWFTLITHLPFGLAIFFIISGSLAVAAERKMSVGLVWASLASHLLSAFLALAGIAYNCALMATGTPYRTICIPEDIEQQFPEKSEEVWIKCRDKMRYLDRIQFGLLGFVLVLLVLQACVSIALSVFSGKAANRRHAYNPVKTCDDRVLLISS